MRRAKQEKTPNDLQALQHSIAEALKQSRLAYEFCPGSYTASALSALLTAAARFRAVLNKTTTTTPLAAAPPSGSNNRSRSPATERRLS